MEVLKDELLKRAFEMALANISLEEEPILGDIVEVSNEVQNKVKKKVKTNERFMGWLFN